MDQEFRCASIMNGILRSAYKEPGKKNSWVLRDPTTEMNPGDGKLEWDHFFEVQHIVALLFRGYYGDKALLTEDATQVTQPNFFMNRSLGEYLSLATFINDPRNLYQVDKVFNAQKKAIAFDDYFPTQTGAFHTIRNPLIQEYLNCECNPGALLKKNQKYALAKDLPTSSVEANLLALVKEMVGYTGDYPALAKEVGTRLAFYMGWMTTKGWVK